MLYNKRWMSAEKKVDENFKGSLWEKMGYESRLCPFCGAHLRKGICLNACHLNARLKKKFNNTMVEIMDIMDKDDDNE